MPTTWDDLGRQPTTVSHRIETSAERAFATLSDAWLLPLWVVGAVHIRAVDDQWPSAGAKMHHQVGAWPVTVSDSTAILEYEPPKRIVLQGRAWPLGEARIELVVEPDGDGALVHMLEAPSHGPPRVLDNPLLRKVLAARNRESLVRLAVLAERRHEPQR